MKKLISKTIWNFDDILYTSSLIQELLMKLQWQIENGYEQNSLTLLKPLQDFLKKEGIEAKLVELHSTQLKQCIGYALDCSGVIWSLIGTNNLEILANFHNVNEKSIYAKDIDSETAVANKYENHHIHNILEKHSRIKINLKNCFFIFYGKNSNLGKKSIVEITPEKEGQHTEAILSSTPNDEFPNLHIQLGSNMKLKSINHMEKIQKKMSNAIQFLQDEIRFSTNKQNKKTLKALQIELNNHKIMLEGLGQGDLETIYLTDSNEPFYFNLNLETDKNKQDFINILSLNITLISLNQIGATYGNSYVLQKNVSLKKFEKCDFSEMKIAFNGGDEKFEPFMPVFIYSEKAEKISKNKIITKKDLISNENISDVQLFKNLPNLKSIINIEKEEHLNKNIKPTSKKRDAPRF